MIESMTLLTIVLMAAATYLTRVLGYLALRQRVLGKRTTTVMEAAPGCVLIAVIAPHFVSTHVADLVALAVTLLAAMRLPMLPTVLVGVFTAAALRFFIG